MRTSTFDAVVLEALIENMVPFITDEEEITDEGEIRDIILTALEDIKDINIPGEAEYVFVYLNTIVQALDEDPVNVNFCEAVKKVMESNAPDTLISIQP